MFSSTDNRSFKQTNFPLFWANSCPSYLKSSDHMNMWSRPRSWPSSVAPRPAGWPGYGRSRRRGRWQRCFILRRFNPYPTFWSKLDSNHWTVDCTLVMRLELLERSSLMPFFVFKIEQFKNCKPKIN